VDDIIDPSKPIYVEIPPKVPVNQVLKPSHKCFFFLKKNSLHDCAFFGARSGGSRKSGFLYFSDLL
jgi:hypothetical protein